jgi:hypothetical protein
MTVILLLLSFVKASSRFDDDVGDFGSGTVGGGGGGRINGPSITPIEPCLVMYLIRDAVRNDATTAQTTAIVFPAISSHDDGGDDDDDVGGGDGPPNTAIVDLKSVDAVSL